MRFILNLLDETSYLGLLVWSLALSILISGLGAILTGGIWVTWSFWDDLGLPTLAIFRGIVRVFYWPGLWFAGVPLSSLLPIALVSFAGWIVTVTPILMLGRLIRTLQGKAWRL